MNTVQYDENNPKSREELILALFDDKNDPRSNSYKRILNRPAIKWNVLVGCIIVWLILMTIIIAVSVFAEWERRLIVIAAILGSVAYTLVLSKQIIIFTIKLYQRYAPASLRNKCRFEPSCSEYMLLAIQKYGLIKGIQKGINRVKRCNTSSGGYDWP